jgi:glycosyltransferase involved in cell wall biosynthesis
MACGVACVATDAGADGEVLEQEAGVILKIEDKVVPQLRALLPQLRDHGSWVKSLGQRARQRVEDRYTLTKNIDQLETLYENLLQERRDPKHRKKVTPLSEVFSRWQSPPLEFPQRRYPFI